MNRAARRWSSRSRCCHSAATAACPGRLSSANQNRVKDFPVRVAVDVEEAALAEPSFDMHTVVVPVIQGNVRRPDGYRPRPLRTAELDQEDGPGQPRGARQQAAASELHGLEQVARLPDLIVPKRNTPRNAA